MPFVKGQVVEGRRPFVKGQSGNPRGTPRRGSAGLAALIRKETNNAFEMAQLHMRIMRGEVIELTQPNGDMEPLFVAPTIKEMQDSAEWLTNRCMGKVPESFDETEDTENPAESMTDTELLASLETH